MKHIFTHVSLFALTIFSVVFFQAISVGAASRLSTDFENFNLGTVNGQNGFKSVNVNTDQAIVANTYGFSELGSKVWRISNKLAGGFSDQPFSFSTPDDAGESTSVSNGLSGGTRQNHFEAEFDFASTSSSTQPMSIVTVSLDRGDGSRMAMLDFEDYTGGENGVEVYFYSVDPNNYTNLAWTGMIKLLSRDKVHRIKIVADFPEGPSNDVVKVYFDGVLAHTGTTWENYYRRPSEGSAPRTVDSLMFRPDLSTPSSDGNGFLFDNIVLTSGIPDTTITDNDPELVIDDTTPALDLTIPATVVNPTLNLSAVQTGLVAETPVQIEATVQTAKGDIGVTIPSGTTITGSAGWDGIIHLPKVSVATVTPVVGAKQTASVALAIEVGSSNYTLNFDNAVRVVLPGQAGKQIGYSQDNGATLTEITTVCVSNALPGGANECKMDSGSDLVVLTNHFTLFAAYSVTTNPSTGPRVIGQMPTVPRPVAIVTPITPVVTIPATSPTVVVTNPATPGYKFTTLMKVGTKNADVKELQKLLTQKGFGALIADGWFGVKTAIALKSFQVKNNLTADGIAGPMTRTALNK